MRSIKEARKWKKDKSLALLIPGHHATISRIANLGRKGIRTTIGL